LRLKIIRLIVIALSPVSNVSLYIISIIEILSAKGNKQWKLPNSCAY
jgi:hypothetical protein